MILLSMLFLVMGFFSFTSAEGEKWGGVVIAVLFWISALFFGAAGLAQRAMS